MWYLLAGALILLPFIVAWRVIANEQKKDRATAGESDTGSGWGVPT
jgi:hypothetical protein